MRHIFHPSLLLTDDASNGSGQFIVLLIVLASAYLLLSVLFIYFTRKSKNPKTVSILEKVRNIATPLFIITCLGCATYLNEEILTAIFSSAVTSTVRSSVGILIRYWDVLLNGTALSTISLISSLFIILVYVFVTFYSQLNSFFVFFINKRRRTASIFKDSSMNVTGKLNDNVLMILPENEFNKASVATRLKAMSEIYIQKRLSILVENPNNQEKPFIEGNSIAQEKLELTSQFTFIAGEPGVGKSMFFIHYLSNYILKKSDDLVIYYDLAQYSLDVKNLKCEEKDLLVVLNSYLYQLYLNKEYKDQNDNFLRRVLKSSKNTTIILDSIDECHVDGMDILIYDSFANIKNVKVMIGTRYAYLLNMCSTNIFKERSKKFSSFLINGYSPKEWDEYVDTVVDKSKATNKELVKQMIRKDISVMFYSEYLNPFMLRAIAQTRLSGDTDEKDSPYSIITNMIERIEAAKKLPIRISNKTLDVIGALSNIKSNDLNGYTILFLNLLGTYSDDYKKDLKVLRERLYTSSSLEKPNFSSGVLSDFYAAHCIFDMVDRVSDVKKADQRLSEFIYDALIGDLFEDHYETIVQFLMLIADQNKHIDSFNKLLDILKENISSPTTGQKDNINKFVFAAFESVYKFTAPRIKKDAKPLEDKIFNNDELLTEKLYAFYFEALKDNYINSNSEIYYDDIYRLITIYGYHKQALLATLEIADLHSDYIYKIVSLIRDSYESCFYDKNEYFSISADKLEPIIQYVFKDNKISENTAKPTLIRCLLNLEFLSHLSKNEDCLFEINKIKEKSIQLLKAQMKGKKLPHYFPYIFDLSKRYPELEFDDSEVTFSDRDLSFDRSSSFVVLDTNVSHSFEASSNLSSLFITDSSQEDAHLNSEIYGVRNSALTTLMVSSSVKEIGEYQFDHCEKLRYVHLFDGLEKIGAFAFIHCSRIQELRIPDTVTLLEESFIEDAFSLKSIRLPKEFTIGNYPFEECRSLETITGGHCNNIPDGMFKGCSSLLDFNLGMFNNIEQISDVAFAYSGNRDVINLSSFKQLEKVGNLAFSGNEIKEIIFPESLKELRMDVFFESKVDRIVFTGEEKPILSPFTFSGMDDIDNTVIVYKGNEYSIEAFKKVCETNKNDFDSNGMFGSLIDKTFKMFFSKNIENKELNDLNLDDCFTDVVDYDQLDFNIGCFGNHEYIQTITATTSKIHSLSRYMFEDNVSLTGIDFSGSSIEEINEGCFIGCSLLKRVVLSEKTTKIGKQSFYLCSKIKLFSYGGEQGQENIITLPDSLEEIGDNAFWGLENIEKVIVRSQKVKVKAHAFSNMKKLKMVELPEGYDIQLFENGVFDGNQNVDIYIGEEKYINGIEEVRIGSSSSRIFKQGLYPNSLVNEKGDPEQKRLFEELEAYFKKLGDKEKKKLEHALDYNDGHGSDAHYWDIEYVDNYHGKKFSGRYRRLLFSKYRPPEYGKTIDETVNEDEFFQEHNRYEINKVYWFRFEPITWLSIGRNSKGEQLYLSEFIIDSMEFNKTTVKINNQPANMYARSTVKEWVDNELIKFVEMNPLEGSILKDGCRFRLAYLTEEEYNKLKGGYTILKAKATNYASSQGTYNYIGDWAAYFIDWPDANNEDCELYIKPDGVLYKGSVDGINADNFVIRTDGGVRPVLIVSID